MTPEMCQSVDTFHQALIRFEFPIKEVEFPQKDIREELNLLNEETVDSDSEKDNDNHNKHLWAATMQALKKSSRLQDYIHKEKQTLAQSMMSIEKIQANAEEISNLGIKKNAVIKKIITHISKAISADQNQDTITGLLDMLTVMITQHKDQGKMVETQKYLNTMESMNMILTVFSDEAFRMEPKICKALLIFGIALLQGGN
jgi:hypothetical protein